VLPTETNKDNEAASTIFLLNAFDIVLVVHAMPSVEVKQFKPLVYAKIPNLLDHVIFIPAPFVTLGVHVVPSGDVALAFVLLAMATNNERLGDHATLSKICAAMVCEVHNLPSVDVAQTLLPTAANRFRSGE
jgi:hypothetical protein